MLENTRGFLNLDGGWAHATAGVARAIENVKRLGGRVLTQKSVKKVLNTNGVTSGVECADGSTIEAGNGFLDSFYLPGAVAGGKVHIHWVSISR
jgi:phytoene dehydrogenase-like protein